MFCPHLDRSFIAGCKVLQEVHKRGNDMVRVDIVRVVLIRAHEEDGTPHDVHSTLGYLDIGQGTFTEAPKVVPCMQTPEIPRSYSYPKCMHLIIHNPMHACL